jgi:membrane protein implicated in regulation of membrane protease activity
MSQESARPAPTHQRSAGLWVLIVVILIPAVVVPLWVPLYLRTDPTLWGFPFFYWFQFLLIPCAAVLTILAFLLSRVADRRDRVGRRDPERRTEDPNEEGRR